jgi:hypothetical protein
MKIVSRPTKRRLIALAIVAPTFWVIAFGFCALLGADERRPWPR